MRFARTTALTCVLVAALGASALLSTGCSSGATTTKDVTYKIGVGMPLTQGAAALGEGITRSARLAVKQANESERARKLGVTFVVASNDDLGDPKTGVSVANMFASDSKIIGVMGHLNSGVCMPASKVYAARDIVMVAPAATNPELTLQGLKNVFRLCTIDTVQGSFGAKAALTTLGFKTAYIVDDSTPYGEGLSARFAEEFKAGGGTIVGTEKTSDKDAEFGALSTKIKAANPDVVYYGGVYNAGAPLMRQLRGVGSASAFFGGDALNDGQFVKLATSSVAEGALSTLVGLPLDKLAKGAEFKTAYAAEFPGKELSAYDAYGYDSTNVIIDAALTVAEKQGVGQVATPQGRKAIIAAVAATDTDGVTGKISFDEKGDTLNKVITLYSVKNGAWTAYE